MAKNPPIECMAAHERGFRMLGQAMNLMEKTTTSAPADPQPTRLADVHALTRIAMFAALIGAGAFIHVPLGPLHISLQPLMVMLTGFCLGPKKAALALAAYLACGFIGLPMFGRGKAGPASFLGPTAGFLAGFFCGAIIAGLSTLVRGSRKKRILAMLFFGSIGTVVVLLLGAIGLRMTIIADWNTALALGLYTFLPGDLIKMVVAMLVKEAFFPPPGTEAVHAS